VNEVKRPERPNVTEPLVSATRPGQRSAKADHGLQSDQPTATSDETMAMSPIRAAHTIGKAGDHLTSVTHRS
jgi:hypothetical protein